MPPDVTSVAMNCTFAPSAFPAASTPVFSAPNQGFVRVPETSTISGAEEEVEEPDELDDPGVDDPQAVAKIAAIPIPTSGNPGPRCHVIPTWSLMGRPPCQSNLAQGDEVRLSGPQMAVNDREFQ